MAKPIQYVVELSAEEAGVFMMDRMHPKPNPARDELIRKAKTTHFEVR